MAKLCQRVTRVSRPKDRLLLNRELRFDSSGRLVGKSPRLFAMKPNNIQVVVEDIEYLRAGWGGSLSDPEARRGSAVLRRLLVENAYGDAWRALGFHGEPRVRAVDLKQIIGSTPLSDVDMALAEAYF